MTPQIVHSKTTTPPVRNLMTRSPLRRAFLLIPLMLGCFGLAPTVRALTEGDLGNANTAEGAGALASITTGTNNTALGAGALNSTTTTSWNTATGAQALKNNTGRNNTADGFQALLSNTIGDDNTGIGWRALFHNTTASDNTATGFQALNRNLADSNTANGYQALFSNTTANTNTATGYRALFTNSTGSGNTADGAGVLLSNTTGAENTASGFQAMAQNTTGSVNTAIGDAALQNNTTGSFNIALGSEAGFNLTTGSSHNIDIGNGGVFADSGTIRIGLSPEHTRTFIAGIRGVTTENANAIAVVIDSAGQLGTMSSSKRFKKEIKPMDNSSEAILDLKPVTFHYKTDKTDTPQFGLIAEEVAQVNSDLVVRDDKGEIYTVRYEAVNAMLLNEFLKEHRTVQALTSAVAKQEAIIEKQQKDFQATAAHQQMQIEALTAGLQKVSAHLEVSKPAQQVVNNP